MDFEHYKGIDRNNSPWSNFSWEPSFASFGIYTRPLAYPQAVHYIGSQDKTYIAYQNKDYDPTIISYNHQSCRWSDPIVLGINPIAGNDHGAPSIAIRDGYIYVFYGAHNSPIKVKRSENVEDISSWLSLPDAHPGSYPQPFVKPNGEIHLFYRGVEELGGRTRACMHSISLDGGETWSNEQPIIKFNDWGVYTSVTWFDPDNLSLTWFKWDIFAPNSIDTRFNVYFAKSNDGGVSWTKANGTHIPLPIVEGNADVVFKSYPKQAYVWDIQIASDNTPIILFTSDIDRSPKYMIAKWNGSSWVIHKIISTHSVRNPGTIDAINSNLIDVYLLKGNFTGRGGELQKYSSKDGGITWTFTDSLMPNATYKAWAPQIVKNYHRDVKVIWSTGHTSYGHIAFHGDAPNRVYIPTQSTKYKEIPQEETQEHYRNLGVHNVGIPKGKVQPEVTSNMTDAELVSFYSEKYIEESSEYKLSNRRERLYGLCNMIKEQEFYLDVGCASGVRMDILYWRGIKGFGIDLSIPNILRGREKFPYLKFIHGFAEEIPFRDKFFDILILGISIQHLRNPKEILAECLRVAKKGIILSIFFDKANDDQNTNSILKEKVLKLLKYFGLTILFFDHMGNKVSEDDLSLPLENSQFIFIRAEKTEETQEKIDIVLETLGLELKKKSKEELLESDQWVKDVEHKRDETEMARFHLVSHLIEGNKVLEIGCGNGDSSLVMAKKGFQVTGIDLSEFGIKQAKEIVKNNNLQDKAQFFVMDATELSFPDNSFDTIVIPEVLEHIRSSKKILEEAIRVLRNGGRIIISVPDGLLIPWQGHLRIFFQDLLETELEQYANELRWHRLPFKKWLFCSFFIKKKELDIKKGPEIDVLIPTYNGKQTIERAIKSVINQTYKNWRLIIVNDGGEEINEIIDEFDDNRIKYFTITHGGKSHALNFGIRNSAGDYITYLDDDDILYPIHFEVLVKTAMEGDKDFVYTDWYEVSVNEDFEEFQREIEFRHDITPSMLITRNYINHKCILHKRSLLKTSGLYDETLDILIDWDMIRRLAFVSKPIHIWSFTSERIRYYSKGILQNKITGLWNRNPQKVLNAILKVAKKTVEMQATTRELTEAIIESMTSLGYYHLFKNLEEIKTKNIEIDLAKKKNSELKITLERKIDELNRLESERKDENEDFKSKIARLNFDIVNLNNDLNLIRNDLNSIRLSITWGLASKIFYILNLLFPPNTKRRELFELIKNGIKSIAYEGIRTFWWKTKQLIREVNPLIHRRITIEKITIPKKETFEQSVDMIDQKVSVVIPTKNGGIDFDYVLNKVKNQKGIKNLEIVVVDSGSIDDTIEIALKYDAKLFKIKPEEFGHGKTRNFGAKQATGDFLIFITQDAIFSNDFLIYNLVKILQNDEKIAAVTCTQVPRSDADLMACFQVWNHYRNFLEINEDKIISIENMAIIPPGQKRKVANLSDSCCGIRRELFLKYKFKRNFAEDLELGIKLLTNKYKLVYLHSMPIIHSHNRSPSYFFKVSYTDSNIVSEILGSEPLNWNAIELNAFYASIKALYGRLVNFISKLETKVTINFDHILLTIENAISLEHSVGSNENYIGEPSLLQLFKELDRIIIINNKEKNCLERIVYNSLLNSYLDALKSLKRFLDNYPSLNSIKMDLLLTLYKLFANSAGATLGNFTLYAVQNDKMTKQLKELDKFLKGGV